MSRLPQLYSWRELVSNILPDLSVPQINGLADLSFGMAALRSTSVTLISQFYSKLLEQKEDTILKRLKDVYLPQEFKKGDQRKSLEETKCFPLLLRWIVSNWASDRIALALDATSHKDIFTILSLSVVYRGCAIPVAWKILKANVPHPWNPEWEAILESVSGEIPQDYTVICLTDRGLYSSKLYHSIRDKGWHPFMRVKADCHFHLWGKGWFKMEDLVPQNGEPWGATGTAFQKNQIDCSLLIVHDKKDKEPWCIITDLPLKYCNVSWYAMRAWIEHGFKKIKSGGLQWTRTRITSPDRVSKVWLAISLSLVWLFCLGTKEEDQLEIPELYGPCIEILGEENRKRRATSLYRKGFLELLCILIKGRKITSIPKFKPLQWPCFRFSKWAFQKNLPL